LFRHLVNSLDIRHGGRGRDSLLYDELRNSLKMGTAKPAEFFIANPGVREQDVLEAFMRVFDPFVSMVEEIYATLGDLRRQGSGGKDFTVRYDSGRSSLKFNLEAFRRFREQRVATQVSRWRVKYDSDAVPGLRYAMESVIEMQDRAPGPAAPTSSTADASNTAGGVSPPRVHPSEMGELLRDLRALSAAHVAVLTSVLAELETGGVDIPTLLSQHGVGPDDQTSYLGSRASLEQWMGFAEFAERVIPSIDVERLFQVAPAEEISEAYERLRRILERLGEKTSTTGYVKAALEFLQLPYWKKRWQVFQIWVFILCLRAFVRRGVKLNVSGSKPLTLKTGETDEPKAHIRTGKGTRLELWTEFPLDGKPRSELRPDIALVVNDGGTRTPAGVIECKQRESASDEVLIKDAEKYAARVAPDKRNLLVNYDKFTGPGLKHNTRLKDGGAETLFLENVGPRTRRGDMVSDYVLALIPPAHADLTFVIDTTESMHWRLPEIWKAVGRMCTASSGRGAAFFSAVLFGDHGPGEPYVTNVLEYTDNQKELLSRLKSADVANGGDVPEALEDAVRAVNSLPPRDATNRHVIFFVDAPPHAAKDCPELIDFEDEVESLHGRAKLWVVNCGGASWADLGWGRFVGRPEISLVQIGDLSSVVDSLRKL
jgi:hypothetical protein